MTNPKYNQWNKATFGTTAGERRLTRYRADDIPAKAPRIANKNLTRRKRKLAQGVR